VTGGSVEKEKCANLYLQERGPIFLVYAILFSFSSFFFSTSGQPNFSTSSFKICLLNLRVNREDVVK
jgi:hypothetical protein